MGVLCHMEEYFTNTKATSIIEGGNLEECRET